MNTVLRKRARASRDRRGVAAIEFALTIGVLLAVLLGIVELSLLMSRLYVVSRAARDAARVGAGVTDVADPEGEIEATAVEHAAFVLNSAENNICGDPYDPASSICTITADWGQDSSGWYLLTVDVAVDYESFTNLLPGLPDQTETTFTMLTQQQQG